jgi:hypothetical protein
LISQSSCSKPTIWYRKNWSCAASFLHKNTRARALTLRNQLYRQILAIEKLSETEMIRPRSHSTSQSVRDLTESPATSISCSRTPVLQDPDVKCFDEEFGPFLAKRVWKCIARQDEGAENHFGVDAKQDLIKLESIRMEPSEEFGGVAGVDGGGLVSPREISRDMWAFLIATAIPPTLFRVRSKAEMFCGTRGAFDERDGLLEQGPRAISGLLCVRRSIRNRLRQLLLDSFHERQGRERVA